MKYSSTCTLLLSLLGTSASNAFVVQRPSTRTTQTRILSSVADAATTTETTASAPPPAASTAPAAPVAATPAPASAAPVVESQQSKYGVSVELPDTYIKCGNCDANFAIREEDLGEGKGCRVLCPVCDHSWFQSRDRLRTINAGSELIPLPEQDKNRIASNIEAGRKPSYVGSVKFYVGNLDFRATEQNIYDVFKTAGEVGEVNLVTDDTGRSRGFAFVTMMEKDSTDKCMELDGTDINGRNINVKPPNN